MRLYKRVIAVFIMLLIVCFSFSCVAFAEEKTENVLFRARVSNELNEKYDYITVDYICKNPRRYDSFQITKKNNWCCSMYLPEGDYEIVGGGILNKDMEYPIEYKSFSIDGLPNTLVEFTCGDVNDIMKLKYYDSESGAYVEVTDEYNLSSVSTKELSDAEPDSIVIEGSSFQNSENQDLLRFRPLYLFIVMGVAAFVAVIVIIIKRKR